MTAVNVLARLENRHPDRFKACHLRTMQRLVKAGRADQAARTVRHGMEALKPLPIAEVPRQWLNIHPLLSVTSSGEATGQSSS